MSRSQRERAQVHGHTGYKARDQPRSGTTPPRHALFRGEGRPTPITAEMIAERVEARGEADQGTGLVLPDNCPPAAPQPPVGFIYSPDGRLVPQIQYKLSLADPEERVIFLELLEVIGTIAGAARAAGISKASCSQHMRQDPGFRDQVDEALEHHRGAFYAAAIQRAVHGVDVPVIGGKFKDEIVAYERRYSDHLLAMLLKRHFKEFREDGKGSTTQVQINNVNGTATPAVDLRKLGRAGRTALRQLLAPADAEQVETEVVSEEESQALDEDSIEASCEEEQR